MGEALNLASTSRQASQYESMRIPAEVVGGWWSKFERELDRVPHIWNEQWTKEALRVAVMTEWVQVWGFGPPGETRVVVFTQIVDYPIGRILQIFLALGNSLDGALPIIEATFEKLAAASGCVFCEIHGRPGWERKFPRFKRAAVVLRCKVEQQGVH